MAQGTAQNGVIDSYEKPDWEEIMRELDELGREIETLKWIARSQQKQKPAQAERVINKKAAKAAQ